MYDVINNLYHLIALLQMETGNVPDRSNISVSTGLQNVTDRYGTDQKAIRYNGNIVQNDASRPSFKDISHFALVLLLLTLNM